MVQRYTTLAGYVEDDDGYFVEYEDYAVLHDLIREVLDNIDPYWDLAEGTQDKLDELGYLND